MYTLYRRYFECLSLLSPDLSDFMFVRFETFIDISRICRVENSTKSKNKIDGGTTSGKRRNTLVIMSFRRKVICQRKYCRLQSVVSFENYIFVVYCSVEHGTINEHDNRLHILTAYCTFYTSNKYSISYENICQEGDLNPCPQTRTRILI